MITDNLKYLFLRDIDEAIKIVQRTPQDKMWATTVGIKNSVGVLAQHIAGNLQHYIGRGLGEMEYVRDRDREFANTGRPAEELINDLKATKTAVQVGLEDLAYEDLHEEFTMPISYDLNTEGFLLHLYGHLQYHIGQMNYLQRILSAQ